MGIVTNKYMKSYWRELYECTQWGKIFTMFSSMYFKLDNMNELIPDRRFMNANGLVKPSTGPHISNYKNKCILERSPMNMNRAVKSSLVTITFNINSPYWRKALINEGKGKHRLFLQLSL